MVDLTTSTIGQRFTKVPLGTHRALTSRSDSVDDPMLGTDVETV